MTKTSRCEGRTNRRRREFRPEQAMAAVSRLEGRLMMAADVNVLAVRDFVPVDGGAVRVSYDIAGLPLPTTSLNFRFVRSADDKLDANDKVLGQFDLSDAGAISAGSHTQTFDLGESMRPDPSRPWVIVVGQVSGSAIETALADNVDAFRKYTIAAVSHGGIQGSSYNIPMWEAKIGHRLQSYGYDAVIPFNWANASRTPGAAAKQAPRLGGRILQEAAKFPAGAGVDIDFIAHSQGTVVVSQAAIWTQKHATPEIRSGFSRMTLLDPHAANPEAPNNDESIPGGFFGWMTRTVIAWYKGNAEDPVVRVPDSIDEADVYYQRTPVSVNGSNNGRYNLLGQVPVIGTARYIQLNSPGIAHSGGSGVYTWFYFNALPAYATGEKPSNPSVLETTGIAARDGVWARNRLTTSDTSPVWQGVSAPGATVRLYVSPAASGVEESRPIATTVADAAGNWTLQPDDALQAGGYQVHIRAFLPAGLPRANTRLMPTIRMGALQVRPASKVNSAALPNDRIALTIPVGLNKNGLGLRLNDRLQTFEPKTRQRP